MGKRFRCGRLAKTPHRDALQKGVGQQLTTPTNTAGVHDLSFRHARHWISHILFGPEMLKKALNPIH